MKKLLMMASLLGTLMFTACSSDEDIATTGNKIEVSDDQFTFTTEDFGTDEGVTRAAASTTTNAAPTKPQTIDLGGGLEAEVSVEQDAPAAQTRATKPISDGHYTVYAVDNATGTRVTGANSKVSGTVSGGKFTKDAGTKLELTPGTYTFVCFNDAVTDNGTNLTVNNGADALIGTSTETISGTGWKVNFTMKHQTARIRFNIVSITSEGTAVAGTMTSGGTHNTSVTYNVDGTTPASTTTGALSVAQTIPTSGAVNDSVTRTYNNATDYYYLLPNVPMNDLTFTFTGGTLYGKSLAGKAFPLASSLKTLSRGGSYTVNIKFTTFLFLFDDGTVGALGDKGSRTPIAYVVKDKTDTEKGTAMGLSHIQGSFNNYIYTGGTAPATENSAQFDESNWLTDMDGYKYTWEASGSADGTTIKALSPKHDLFQAAAAYTPSVPVTGANVGKWYVPALGEVYLMYKRFRIADLTLATYNSTTFATTGAPQDLTYFQPIANSVGGEIPYGIWRVSTEYMPASYAPYATGVEMYDLGATLEIHEMVKSQTMSSWPFVHY